MRNVKASGPVALRKLNRGTVLDILRAERPISRTGLARRARLSKPTISVIVEQLLALDLVREVGLGHSRRGRRPVMLDFNPDARLVVGAELQELEWVIVLTNLDGRVQERLLWPAVSADPRVVVGALAEGLNAVCRNMDPASSLGWALACRARFRCRPAVVALSLALGWTDVPLKEI